MGNMHNKSSLMFKIYQYYFDNKLIICIWTNWFWAVVKTSSGDTFGIVCKRSIIENIEVDFGKVRNAMRLVDEKILAAKW